MDTRWFGGSVVLKDGDVQTGYVTVEAKFDLVLLKNDLHGNIQVLPAHKVQSVFFYDSVNNINRRFIAIQLSQASYKPYRLYEVVIQGQVSLLRRQDTGNDTRLPGNDGFYYFVHMKSDFIPLKRFRTKVYPALLLTSLDGFPDYVHRNKLNPNSPSNAVRIIQCYNAMYVHQMLSMR
jgi:hypothetical protein